MLFLQFFSLTILSDESFLKIAAIWGTGILLMVISIIGLLFQKGVKKNLLDYIVILFIVCMILSSFMANLYWDQSFLSSLKGYLFYYIYFIYIIFLFVNIPVERIERIMLVLFVISLIIFFVDYITFPNPLFAYRSEERRNGITIFFYGQGFTFLGAFYFLNKFFYKKNLFHLLLFALSGFCLFLLTQSRQNLIALTLGFFLILMGSDFKKKYLVALLLIFAGVILYTTPGILEGIKEDTNDQAQYYKDDIRIAAHNYFLTKLQKGTQTLLFGNGVAGAGSSLAIERYNGVQKGFYIADVGLTGIFSCFGLFGVIIWLLFFYYVFKMKNNQNSLYIKAYFLTLLSTAFSGYSIFEPGYMPATVLALYLVRCEISRQDEILT